MSGILSDSKPASLASKKDPSTLADDDARAPLLLKVSPAGMSEVAARSSAAGVSSSSRASVDPGAPPPDIGRASTFGQPAPDSSRASSGGAQQEDGEFPTLLEEGAEQFNPHRFKVKTVDPKDDKKWAKKSSFIELTMKGVVELAPDGKTQTGFHGYRDIKCMRFEEKKCLVLFTWRINETTTETNDVVMYTKDAKKVAADFSKFTSAVLRNSRRLSTAGLTALRANINRASSGGSSSLQPPSAGSSSGPSVSPTRNNNVSPQRSPAPSLAPPMQPAPRSPSPSLINAPSSSPVSSASSSHISSNSPSVVAVSSAPVPAEAASPVAVTVTSAQDDLASPLQLSHGPNPFLTMRGAPAGFNPDEDSDVTGSRSGSVVSAGPQKLAPSSSNPFMSSNGQAE